MYDAHDPLASAGCYKVQLVRHGAWLPARIWCEEDRDAETGDRIGDDRYYAEIGTDRVDVLAPPRWPEGWHAVSRAEWEYLRADLLYCRTHAPDKPICHPTIPARLCGAKEFF